MSRGMSCGAQHRCLFCTDTEAVTHTGLGQSVTYTVPVLRPKTPSSALLEVIWIFLLVLCEVPLYTCIRTWVQTQLAGRVIAEWDGRAPPRTRHVIWFVRRGTWWDTPRSGGIGRFLKLVWPVACDSVTHNACQLVTLIECNTSSMQYIDYTAFDPRDFTTGNK